MRKIANPALKLKNYLIRQASKSRPFIATIFMLIIYLFLYFLVKKTYYTIADENVYILMPHGYFPVFFLLSTLPFFTLIFLKHNIWTNFWNQIEKPHFIDYLFFGTIILFLYFSFNQFDLVQTASHSYSLLDMILSHASIFDFYNYTQGHANYLLPYYILFGIWSIPVKIFQLLAGIPPFSINAYYQIHSLTLWWYKLLPSLFYFASAFIIYKISIYLNFTKQKAKWISFIWIIFPMAMFSQFIFGQYDSIGVFFDLLMIYLFLQKKIMKASLLCMVAITFKPFSIFVFLPLLLLFEKRIFRILGYAAITFVLYLFFTLLYSGSDTFIMTSNFKKGMFDRLLVSGIPTAYGTVSFFILTFIFACISAYFINTKKNSNFCIKKYVLFIPLFVYSMLFSCINWHPQWLLILTPYLVLNIFLNKNNKGLIFITMAASVAFLFLSIFFYPGNVDANMINMGVFPKIFGFVNAGENFKSISSLATFGGRIPAREIHMTFFVGMLLSNLILSFPTKKNLFETRNIYLTSFSIKRDIVWTNGLIVLLIVVPSLFLFLTQGVSLKDTTISIVQPDIETVKKNIYNIESVNMEGSKIILNCGKFDPQLYIPLLHDSIERPSAMPFIELTYTNTISGPLQIFYDYGDGLSQKKSVSTFIPPSKGNTTMRLNIKRWDNQKKLIGFRIDPPESSEFVLINTKIISSELIN